MKKVIINVILIITIAIIYMLQANFFNWFTIAGVMPNLFIIIILFIGLFAGQTMGIIYGVFLGLFLDLVIGKQVGISAVLLGTVGFLSAIFDKNFSKDSRATMMFIVLTATAIFEIANYITNYVIFKTNVEILNFIRILAIELIYNLILTIIIYPLMQKSGYYIENEYKGSKILTKYF